MLKKVKIGAILLILLFFPGQILAMEGEEAEIFHINKGKVVRKIPMTKEISGEIEKLLKGIDDVYKELKPIPEKGYMIKFPLGEGIPLQNKWFEGTVKEVIVIFPEYENPHLMFFDQENRAMFFTFNRSASDLLSKINFIPKPFKEKEK